MRSAKWSLDLEVNRWSPLINIFIFGGDGKVYCFRDCRGEDYRNHGRKGKLFSSTLDAIGKVDCLITEGTALSRHNNVHYKSEVEIEKEAKEIMSRYDQVFVLSSSTNLKLF